MYGKIVILADNAKLSNVRPIRKRLLYLATMQSCLRYVQSEYVHEDSEPDEKLE